MHSSPPSFAAAVLRRRRPLQGNQIAYGTFFPNTKRTGRLIRTTTAGNKPLPDQIPTGAWNSFAGIGNTRFVVNESYDQTLTPLSYVTISAEASTSGSSSIDSASSYLVNELYKFRVMILVRACAPVS